MISLGTARTIVGIIGNVISFCLFISPAPTFWRIIKNKSVEEFRPDPYLAAILNCAFWVLYGLPIVTPDSTLVITINGFGLGLELVYIAIYVTFADKKGKKKVCVLLLCEAIFTAAMGTGIILGLHSRKKRSLALGIICDVFNVIMYCAPLTIMKKVIETKSVKYMPFYLSLANFLNGCVWSTYALIKLDLFILVSNGLGVLFGTLQLVIYAIYHNKSSTRDPDPADETVKGQQVRIEALDP